MHACGRSGTGNNRCRRIVATAVSVTFPESPLDAERRARSVCEDEMYVPTAKDIVEIAGLPDLFQVLWVNEPRRRADLLAVRERPYAIPDVPFTRLRPFQADADMEAE